MAVYYKFKSAKDNFSIPVDGPFISIANLKISIYVSKNMRKGTDYDLIITNAQTNEEYLDEEMLIPRNTSVLVRRVPGLPRMPIVIQTNNAKFENQTEDDQSAKSSITTAESSGILAFEDSEMDDEFGSNPFAMTSEIIPGQSRLSSSSVQDSVCVSKADKDNKIKALVGNSGLNWQLHHTDDFGSRRGSGRGEQSTRGFVCGGLELKTPPQGYVCHRCKVPGHYIQHCPTNGDPNYDIKKARPATGIPKSMLVPTPDGSFVLPSGTAAALKPNEAAFDKEMEGLSTCSFKDLPPELHCPLCKEVMKDAVLSSKCCFGSFCDKCIRDYIISKSMCVCGIRDILTDDLVPNNTLRNTINRILESSGNSSVDNPGSSAQVPDKESAHHPQTRISSPTQSAVSEGAPDAKEISNLKENMDDGGKPSDAPQVLVQPQTSGEDKITKVPDVSEATHEYVTVKEPASQDSALPLTEGGQPKVAVNEAGKKKKRRKVSSSVNVSGVQWMSMTGIDENMCNSAFNPYQRGMQPAVNGFMGPYGGNMPYNMGYGPGSMDMFFGNFISPDSFGAQGFMMPQMLPPQRDHPKDRDCHREARSNDNVLPEKSELKPASAHRSSREEHHDYYHDRNHDRKRETKRVSIDHDNYHCSHQQISQSHQSFDHDSHGSYRTRPSLKRKSEHYEMDHHHNHHYGRSKSSSLRQ
ncbi:E3 ubiquitin ligase PQT3-like isoform X2 [Chenopodium quinoa]|uniref:E3 ubiquitin ligase PQT3-like isoform X2 n=1 Tax=Chenopodium quinoa TaxID=63459 RepID=UPI000B77FC4E|nr:E3 ubiquitin ligase PQT3-like isoform X2 [Chenopodium quinoa]